MSCPRASARLPWNCCLGSWRGVGVAKSGDLNGGQDDRLGSEALSGCQRSSMPLVKLLLLLTFPLRVQSSSVRGRADVSPAGCVRVLLLLHSVARFWT